MSHGFATTPALHGFCMFAAIAVIVQLFFLAEPPFAERIVQLMWDKTGHFLLFGAIASCAAAALLVAQRVNKTGASLGDAFADGD